MITVTLRITMIRTDTKEQDRKEQIGGRGDGGSTHDSDKLEAKQSGTGDHIGHHVVPLQTVEYFTAPTGLLAPFEGADQGAGRAPPFANVLAEVTAYCCAEVP